MFYIRVGARTTVWLRLQCWGHNEESPTKLRWTGCWRWIGLGAGIAFCGGCERVWAKSNFRHLLKTKELVNTLLCCITPCPSSLSGRNLYLKTYCDVAKCTDGYYITTKTNTIHDTRMAAVKIKTFYGQYGSFVCHCVAGTWHVAYYSHYCGSHVHSALSQVGGRSIVEWALCTRWREVLRRFVGARPPFSQ